VELAPPLDDRGTWSSIGDCPVEKTMSVVGSRNPMLIMREAFYGTTRFDDFAQRVGMAPATTSANLRALADAGLLRRQPYRDPGGRTRDEYLLTESGRDLMPVLFALFRWGQKHGGNPPLLDLAHIGCGGSVDVAVTCGHDHTVGFDEVELRTTIARRPDRESGL
jgi:DNA-binding HxlR family transcriptional regulator